MPKKGYVYEFLDEHDDIVYIGSSGDITQRMRQHFTHLHNGKLGKKEYASVKKIRYAECDSRNGASIAEIFLIQKYCPCYNTEYSEWGQTQIVDLDEDKLNWTSKTPEEFMAMKDREKKSKVTKIEAKSKKIRAINILYPGRHIRPGKESKVQKWNVARYLLSQSLNGHLHFLDENVGTDEEWTWAIEMLGRSFERVGLPKLTVMVEHIEDRLGSLKDEDDLEVEFGC